MTLDIPSGPTLSLGSWEDAEQLFRSRRESLVRIDQPLVLVSQIQRSGGTLLNSLLDGHPELHVHPYELLIGHPTKYDWPALDIAAGADAWLRMLEERRLGRLFRSGYVKVASNASLMNADPLPFTVVPSLLASLFRLVCHERAPRTPRDVLDRYFTAYFNAWMDCAGLRSEPKRWVAGFAPRLAWAESRSGFLADYPEGRLLTVLRDPRGWYASARVFAERYGDLDAAVELWRTGATQIAAAKREAPDRVLVLSFEALVAQPRATMQAVAAWLGIGWDPILETPTFNRLPTMANSSHDIAGTGVHAEQAERWRTALEPDVIASVERRLMAQHAEVSALVDVVL